MDVTGSIDTKDPTDTNKEVRRIYGNLFGAVLFNKVDFTLEAIVQLFDGKYPGYQKCDLAYHNLEHTLQVYLATARIFGGLLRGNGAAISKESMIIGLISALGHDTGFIKEKGDNKGSGAKYTLIHVDRSKGFMGKYLPKIGFKSSQIECVKNAMSCTGLELDLSMIPFTSEEERLTGYIVGTADFLGQMSDPEYPARLEALFDEYMEGGVPEYSSAKDLIIRTPAFFEQFVMKRLKNEFHSVYRFGASQLGGKDLYIEGIRKNIKKIQECYCCKG
ncbi:hypothetical protein ACFLWZ_07910 [Chloroflexota bacterium]